MRRNGRQDDAAGTHAGIFADLDIAEDLGARGKQHAAANFRMPVTFLLAGTTERDPVQHGHVVFHHRRFADDDSRRVVHHDATPYPRRGMNVHAEKLRHAALQEICKRGALTPPVPMRDPVTLQRMETFEEEKAWI